MQTGCEQFVRATGNLKFDDCARNCQHFGRAARGQVPVTAALHRTS